MKLRTLFATVRLMLSILFRFTPIQSTNQVGLQQNTAAAINDDEDGAQGSTVIPFKKKVHDAAPVEEQHSKAA